MTDNLYDDLHRQLVHIQSIRDDAVDPELYNTFGSLVATRSRSHAFDDLMLNSYPFFGFCGCGNSNRTLGSVKQALEYCALDNNPAGLNAREDFLEKHFGVRYTSDSGVVEFLFHTLSSLNLIAHTETLDFSILTTSGEIFLELATEFLKENPEGFGV